MSRFLYLMRHAQSADKHLSQADKERELTPKGLNDAILIGAHLFRQKINFDIVVSSTAIRAKHTAELVVDASRMMPDKIQLEEELFTASVRTFLSLVNHLDDAFSHVMCVGHNPVISYLAEYLTKAEIGDMPPAGLVIIKFNTQHWKEISQGSGELINFLTPENLIDAQ
ncbi:MAG TPA: histidine phosphatase family protein [Cyclobacteriaceae bacterium]|nr:histidine phosphatase family protein [Cyclobacteriaceae bacterium]